MQGLHVACVSHEDGCAHHVVMQPRAERHALAHCYLVQLSDARPALKIDATLQAQHTTACLMTGA